MLDDTNSQLTSVNEPREIEPNPSGPIIIEGDRSLQSIRRVKNLSDVDSNIGNLFLTYVRSYLINKAISKKINVYSYI